MTHAISDDDEPNIHKLAAAWITLQYAQAKSQAYADNFWAFTKLSDLCEASPNRCWDAIQEIRRSDGSDEILANLAAGPLEDLLVQHGNLLINEIETLAGQDQQLKRLLGAVWQNDIPDDVWARIKRVAGPTF